MARDVEVSALRDAYKRALRKYVDASRLLIRADETWCAMVSVALAPLLFDVARRFAIP